MSLLLSVHKVGSGWSLSDGINSIHVDGAFFFKRDSLMLFEDCLIELKEIQAGKISMSLVFSTAQIVMPIGAGNQPGKPLEDELTQGEQDFLKNVIFERRIREGDLQSKDLLIDLDDMLESTSRSAHSHPPPVKRVKTL